jgi:hypothetical protein
MAKLLMNLRDVPDDEADEVRALLDAHRIEFYETRPSLWGISAGGLWAARDEQLEEAKAHLAGYQAERARRAREQRDADLREGRVEGAWAQFRRQPLQVLAAVIGIVLMVALTLLPFLLLRG